MFLSHVISANIKKNAFKRFIVCIVFQTLFSSAKVIQTQVRYRRDTYHASSISIYLQKNLLYFKKIFCVTLETFFLPCFKLSNCIYCLDLYFYALSVLLINQDKLRSTTYHFSVNIH